MRKHLVLLTLLVIISSCSPEQLQDAEKARQTAVSQAEILAKTAEILRQTTVAAGGTAIAAGGSAIQTIEAGQIINKGMQSPVRGAVTIGVYRPHVEDHIGPDLYAVDFTNSDNLTVYPTLPGKVVFSGKNCDTKSGKPPCYGNVVAIAHDDGLYCILSIIAGAAADSRARVW